MGVFDLFASIAYYQPFFVAQTCAPRFHYTSRISNGRTFQNMLEIKRKNSSKKTILRVIRSILRYFKCCEEELLDFSDILLFISGRTLKHKVNFANVDANLTVELLCNLFTQSYYFFQNNNLCRIY